MEQVLGNHLGVVVQNNDPKKRGRLKIFVPHLMLNLYDKWDNLNENKSFDNLADPHISDIIDNVRDMLPWANCAAPIVGENGDHYFDSYNIKSTSGDDTSKTGDKPAKSYETNPPKDYYNNSYTPASYSQSAKGMFSIPKVGSKVWVFFENGHTNRPVYFATSYDDTNWDTISDEQNYPDKLENYSTRDGKSPDTNYQNKLVVSQKGGVIEIINTDNQESVKITQYNGSFKLWANGGAQELVVGDDKKLVTGNSQTTINESQSVYVGGNVNIIVEGNTTLTTDNLTVNGDVNINGDLDVSKSITEVTAGSIDLTSHVHGGVSSGGSTTSGPQ
jgi:phage baseplate assembly protein gpV